MTPRAVPGRRTASAGGRRSATKVRVFIPHEVVFPGEPSTFDAFRDLLRTLSRTDALIWCARLNHTLDNSGHHEDHFIQNRAARRFLQDEHLDRINAWARRERRSQGDTNLFFRGQLLELICWVALLCDDLPGDGHTFEDEATRVRFTRAALMVSDAWGTSVYQDDFRATGSPEEDRVRAAAAVRRGLSLSTSRSGLLEAIARGSSIYGGELRAGQPEFERFFSQASGMRFDEYLALAIALAMFYGVRSGDVIESSSALFAAARIGDHLAPDAREKVPVFLAMFSQTPSELAAALHADDPNGSVRWRVRRTYRPLRNKPILRTADGRMVILDPGMMSEALTMGPLFAAAGAASRGTGNTLFGAFGDAVEAYAASLLAGMYPSSPVLASRLVLNPTVGRPEERFELCDAVLHGVDSAALFEVKGVFIADQHVTSTDPAAFSAAVLRQYASGSSKGERPKGVTQLARAVRRLARGDARLDGLRPRVTLYPVLVTFDDLVAAPGTADILRGAFASELAGDGRAFPLDVGGLRVAQVTIMTMTDLELLDRLVETTELLDVLRAYAAEGGRRSFHDHLAENQAKYGIAIHGRQVSEIADAALDRAKSFLFGDNARSS